MQTLVLEVSEDKGGCARGASVVRQNDEASWLLRESQAVQGTVDDKMDRVEGRRRHRDVEAFLRPTRHVRHIGEDRRITRHGLVRELPIIIISLSSSSPDAISRQQPRKHALQHHLDVCRVRERGRSTWTTPDIRSLASGIMRIMMMMMMMMMMVHRSVETAAPERIQQIAARLSTAGVPLQMPLGLSQPLEQNLLEVNHFPSFAADCLQRGPDFSGAVLPLSLIHISEPTRPRLI
eukprot:2468362-Rhodomonas_salina.3